ncbi:MAG TPA: HNH endonuclease, partial [Spirochaetia bacterium]|nr:HNH endonuclease [Spirochaetia bacterium]
MDQTDRHLQELQKVLESFEQAKLSPDIRTRVKALIPAFDSLRELGKSLVPKGLSISARDRLLSYFLAYPRTVLGEKELALVAGISEWARRVRELRVQFGWRIITGVTARQMQTEDDLSEDDIDLSALSPNDYVLLDPTQDREAAHRWNLANEIRKGSGGGREKILKYLRANVGKIVTGEELSYVARSSEWARRARELRTEEGWPISTKMSGNPSLPVGAYILEFDRQAPAHDRHISEPVRRQALRRDDYACRKCGWSHDRWNAADPRFLELHHVVHHV